MELIPELVTGHVRYDWQITCAAITPGTVLNVGCNEDPAGLRERFGDRVVNCDLEGHDRHMSGRPNRVDRIFNCLETPWPFADDAAELVLFGDILEHFTEKEMTLAVAEAARVGTHLCITVPEDTRIDPRKAAKEFDREHYNLHTTIVTRKLLERVIKRGGWKLEAMLEAAWQFDDITGWCAYAVRA